MKNWSKSINNCESCLNFPHDDDLENVKKNVDELVKVKTRAEEQNRSGIRISKLFLLIDDVFLLFESSRVYVCGAMKALSNLSDGHEL